MNSKFIQHSFFVLLLLTSVVFCVDVQCGERFSAKKDRKKSFYRIVGGKDAINGDFPWQVSIQKGGRHYCGGSVISKRWILTAAHCLKPLTESMLPSAKILVGSMYHDNRDKSGTFYDIEDVLIHKTFDPKNFINDIGLIKVSKEIAFTGGSKKNGAVAPVCLPPSDTIYSGTATISGWGSLKWKGKFPSRMQALDLKILDDSYCKRSSSARYDADRHLCAGYLEGKKDACEGDSGGPLVTLIGDTATLIGIVSYGQECALPGYPGVYTEVSFYRGWIESKSGESF